MSNSSLSDLPSDSNSRCATVESQLVEGVDGEVCLAKELWQEPKAKLVMLRDRKGVFVPGLDDHDVRSSLPSYRPPRSLKLSDGFGS